MKVSYESKTHHHALSRGEPFEELFVKVLHPKLPVPEDKMKPDPNVHSERNGPDAREKVRKSIAYTISHLLKLDRKDAVLAANDGRIEWIELDANQ